MPRKNRQPKPACHAVRTLVTTPHPRRDMNQLYYGDNLQVLREHIRDDSVDLIYLDLARPPADSRLSLPPPRPFNSKRDYNLLFKSPKGHESEAQITAFEDSWHWGEQAEREFDELVHAPNTDVSEMMQALRRFLGLRWPASPLLE